jgi:murein biosynthesis integral membrane protein MurJ
VTASTTTLTAGTSLRRVATDSFIGSVGTMVSRATGLLRLAVVAAVLGPTQFANLYQAANSLPNLAFELLTGAMVASLLVPVLVRHLDRGDRAASAHVASVFLTLSVVAGLVFVVLAVAAGRLVLHVLTAGVPIDAVQTEYSQAWLLLGLLLLQVPLYLSIATAAAAQTANGRFALPSGAPCVENLGIIAVLGVYASLFGTGAPAGPGFTGILLLGAGTTGAVALHAAVQWWGARRCGVVLILTRKGWRDAEVWAVLRLAVPSVAYAGLNAVRYFCALVIAAAIPGGVVALTLAWAFYNLPSALVAKPVAQAALPPLARTYHCGDDAAHSETFHRSLGMVVFLTVPVAVAYAVLSGPLAAAVAFGEMATPQGRELVHLAVLGISLGVIGDGLVHFITQAAYARRDAARPLGACALRTGLTVAGMFGALLVLDGPALLVGIGSSIALGDLVAGLALYWMVRRAMPGRRKYSSGSTTRTLAAGLAMVPATALLVAFVGPHPGHVASTLTVLGACAVGAVVYLGVQVALRSPVLDGVLPPRRTGRHAVRPAFGRAAGPAPPSSADVLTAACFTVVAAVLAVIVAASPKTGLALAVAALVVLLTVLRPVWAVVGFVALDPLVVGIDRGSLVPGLRLNEVLLGLVLVGLIPVALRAWAGRDARAGGVHRLDLAVFALAFTGSVTTLLWMYARGREIASDDLLYALTLWKLFALYTAVRLVLRDTRTARAALVALLASTGLIGAIGVLQAIGVGPVVDALAALVPPEGGYEVGNRATSTVGNSSAYGDVLLYGALIAAALGLRLPRARGHLGLAGVLALCALASGQFSILIALVLTAIAFSTVTRTLGRSVLALGGLAVVAVLVLQPVLAARIRYLDPGTGLPSSWTGPYGRLTNLEQFFWPQLVADHNWLFGVRTAGRVPGLEFWRQWVYIESGYTWALWTGGLPLLVAVLALLALAVRTGRRLLPSRTPVTGAMGIVVTTLAWSLAVLLLFDPHLTFRGGGEIVFVLLALAANLDAGRHVPDRRSPRTRSDGLPQEADGVPQSVDGVTTPRKRHEPTLEGSPAPRARRLESDVKLPEPMTRALDWVLPEQEAPPSPPRRHADRRRPRRRTLIASLALVVALVLIGSLWAVPALRRAAPPPGGSAAAPAPSGDDPVQRRTLAELGDFTRWLQDNHVEGYIGEVGIPGDDPRWLPLARKWFEAADRAGLWVDAWASGEWWQTDYSYSVFAVAQQGGPVAVARPSGELLSDEARDRRDPLGVNVSGGEFGAPALDDETSTFSNKNPGIYDRDYHYDSQATFDYLASQGMKTVRLPFRWERIQPTLGGDLDPAELTRLRGTVQRAAQAGLRVILDVQNFGHYFLDDGGQGVSRPIGSAEVPVQDFTDLWSRLSAAFAGQPGVLAYDLMNEPADLNSTPGMTAAQVWETASQEAVNAIRARGDTTLIMVPGYDYSHAGEFAENHPWAWIVDPADNIRYTAHHYWREGSNSYDTELQRAAADGY